jgi:hypothetical protein
LLLKARERPAIVRYQPFQVQGINLVTRGHDDGALDIGVEAGHRQTLVSRTDIDDAYAVVDATPEKMDPKYQNRMSPVARNKLSEKEKLPTPLDAQSQWRDPLPIPPRSLGITFVRNPKWRINDNKREQERLRMLNTLRTLIENATRVLNENRSPDLLPSLQAVVNVAGLRSLAIAQVMFEYAQTLITPQEALTEIIAIQRHISLTKPQSRLAAEGIAKQMN